MKTGSFCSGICAPEVAWRELGWEPVFFSEIDPFASVVEAHHFSDVPNLGDMNALYAAIVYGQRTIRRRLGKGKPWESLRDWLLSIVRKLDSADLIVAGTPCQAFSVAGKRGSLDDHRGNLTLTFVELVHGCDPRFVVWENVPGVLSTKDNAFGCFLAGLVGEGEPLVCRGGTWPNAGMVAGPRRTAAWRVLDAQYFGLAQRRRRVFVVSCRTSDGINPGAVLFEPESLPRDSAPSREARARVAASLTRGTDSGGKGGYAGRRQEDDQNIVVSSLDAHMGMGGPDDNAAQANHLVPSTGDVAHCLNAGGMGRLDYEAETLVAHSLRADGPGHDPVGSRVRQGMAVRRLTPVECERLQGFPDDYTAIKYRGKPAADGPRYRAMGNSMAVPVLRWIGKRIQMVEEARAAS